MNTLRSPLVVDGLEYPVHRDGRSLVATHPVSGAEVARASSRGGLVAQIRAGAQ
jgi:hypothetical protein